LSNRLHKNKRIAINNMREPREAFPVMRKVCCWVKHVGARLDEVEHTTTLAVRAIPGAE
jgi:hypothetical protein